MVLTRVRIPRRALGREVHILLLAAHPVTRPSWLIAVMGYEEAGLLLIPPHPHAGHGHRAGLSRSDADGLVLSGGTPKTDVQPGSPPLRKERSQPPSGRPAATGLVPLMQTGRHDVPRTRLFEGSNPSRDTGVCEDMWRDHSHNPPPPSPAAPSGSLLHAAGAGSFRPDHPSDGAAERGFDSRAGHACRHETTRLMPYQNSPVWSTTLRSARTGPRHAGERQRAPPLNFGAAGSTPAKGTFGYRRQRHRPSFVHGDGRNDGRLYTSMVLSLGSCRPAPISEHSRC